MKRSLTRGVLLLGCVFAVTLAGLAQDSGIKTDPQISAIVSNVNSTNIGNTAATMKTSGPASLVRANPKKGRE
jgi:hypothetical protein